MGSSGNAASQIECRSIDDGNKDDDDDDGEDGNGDDDKLNTSTINVITRLDLDNSHILYHETFCQRTQIDTHKIIGYHSTHSCAEFQLSSGIA